MKYSIAVFLTLIILSFSGFGQENNAVFNMIFSYEKVTEFIFDKDVHDFVAKDSIVFSDSIIISESKVFVKGHSNNPDKSLIIINTGKERVSGRKKYTCQKREDLYVVVVSPNNKYISIIGLHNKYIYKIKTSKSDDK